MKEYLPEWKIYLWKKLILNQPDPAKLFCADDFMYFNVKEQQMAWLDDAQTSVNRLKRIEWLSSNVKVTKFDMSSDTPSNKRYFAFDPKEILVAFIELAEQNPASLEISEITIPKDFITKYKELRKEYSEKFGEILPDDKRLTDPLCGLSKDVYKKVKESQKLTLEELIEVVNATSEMPMLEMVSFKLKVDTENLSTHLNAYIDEFISGNLVPYKNVRYFQFDRQKKALLDSLLQMAKDFGPKNITATFEQLGNSGAWTIDDQHHYRFYETLFALERIGEIEIKDIRGSEVIVSLEEQAIDPENNTSRKDRPARVLSPAEYPITEASKDGLGYLIIQNHRIVVGESKSGKFKLLEILGNYKFGKSQNIETVFDSIKGNKDKNKIDSTLDNPYRASSRKLELLKNQTKEINRAIRDYKKKEKVIDLDFQINLKTDKKIHPKTVWFEKRVGRGG